MPSHFSHVDIVSIFCLSTYVHIIYIYIYIYIYLYIYILYVGMYVGLYYVQRWSWSIYIGVSIQIKGNPNILTLYSFQYHHPKLKDASPVIFTFLLKKFSNSKHFGRCSWTVISNHKTLVSFKISYETTSAQCFVLFRYQPFVLHYPSNDWFL